MVFPSPIVGPVAPYNNVPINAQYFQPSTFTISALTLGTTTTVTTAVNHNYVVGQLIRVTIPQIYGTFQISEQTGYVTSVPAANQVLVTINSTNADPFVSSPSGATTKPQIMPVGDINSGATNSSGRVSNITFILGSFINISPL